jgi:predicted signal transduction protein with EAL and GGDEF domain
LGSPTWRRCSKGLAKFVSREDSAFRGTPPNPRAGEGVSSRTRHNSDITLLLTGLRATGEAALVAEKVMAVFRAPFAVAGQELYVTASLGIAVSPDDGTRPSVLLKNADTAMYRAKERGRNCFEIYSVDMNAAAEARL